MYTTKKLLEILQISRPTLYKVLKELNFEPKRTSKNGKYIFSDNDVILLKNYSSNRNIGKKMFLFNVYDDVLEVLLSYSKKIDPENGEDIYNNFFKSYKKGMILNHTKLN